MPDQTAEDPLDKVRGWVRKQGYALEYEVANLFSQAGLWSRQGRTYVDETTDKTRDIDVVAELPPVELSPEKGALRFFAVVECKLIPEPWLVRKTRMVGPQLFWRPIATNPIGESGARRANRTFPVPDIPDPTGFDVVQMVSNKKTTREDGPFAALSQVVSAARGVMRSEHPAFVFPVLVVDGELVSFDYARDGSERLSFSQWERILWGGGPGLSVPTMVDIVTRPFIREYAGRIFLDLDRVRDEVPVGIIFDPPDPDFGSA